MTVEAIEAQEVNREELIAAALTLITGGFEAWLIERKMEHVLDRDSEDANGQYARTGRKAVLHKLAAEYLAERESELEEASL